MKVSKLSFILVLACCLMLFLFGCKESEVINLPPYAAMQVNTTDGTVPLTIYFNLASSEDPDGSIASFELDFDDGSEPVEGDDLSKKILHTYQTSGNYKPVVSITDNHGETSRVSIEITVNPPPDQSPTVEIETPEHWASFKKEELIHFEGKAHDPEDGKLDSDSLVWTSDLQGQIGTGSSFSRNNLFTGVHTITLSATDSQGHTSSDQIKINVREPCEDKDNQAP